MLLLKVYTHTMYSFAILLLLLFTMGSYSMLLLLCNVYSYAMFLLLL